MVAINEISLEREKSRVCDEILHALPQWFGVERSIAEYTHTVKAMTVYAAYDGLKAVGFIAVKRHNAYTSEIAVMGVLPEYHRQGIGKRLVECAINYCKNKKMEFLSVKTLDDSGPSMDYGKTRLFYLEVGFRPLEVFPLYWDKDNPCLMMVLAINNAGF